MQELNQNLYFWKQEYRMLPLDQPALLDVLVIILASIQLSLAWN